MSDRRTEADTVCDPDADWQLIKWSRHTRDIMVDGRRVHYVDVGAGPAVVLIHGQGGCWQWWLRTIPTLAAQTRVIAVDLAGFGESDPIKGSDTIGQQIATVIAVLDHLKLMSAAVVGHSMGGVVALELTRRAPHRVRGLIMVDSAADAISPVRLRVVVAALRIFNVVFSAQSGRPAFVAKHRRLRSAFFSVGMKHPAMMTAPLALQLLPRMAAPGFMSTLKAAASYAANAPSPEVSCPTRVFWGDSDRIFPLRVGQALTTQIPGARLQVFDGGHSPMLETPQQFVDAVAGFVVGLTRDSGQLAEG